MLTRNRASVTNPIANDTLAIKDNTTDRMDTVEEPALAAVCLRKLKELKEHKVEKLKIENHNSWKNCFRQRTHGSSMAKQMKHKIRKLLATENTR
jgi:hypothetical protein